MGEIHPFYESHRGEMEAAMRQRIDFAAAIDGLSERLLVSHYVNNYAGALRRLNAIRARLAALDWAGTPVFALFS